MSAGPPAPPPCPSLPRMAAQQLGQMIRRPTAGGWVGLGQLWGKLRRAGLVSRAGGGESGRRLTRRRGACARCGACCQLMFRCRFLDFDPQGLALCAIYEHRSRVCRLFPLDPRDLANRDQVLPGVPCGFTFAGYAEGRERKMRNSK